MKAKYILIGAVVCSALAITIHRGLTQSPPVIVGPGYAPNLQTPPDPNALAYYGGYFGSNYDEGLYSANPYHVYFGLNDIPRTPDKMTTKMTATSVTFQWDGEPRAVQTITFALLDKNNATVSKQVISKPPARATLRRTAKTTGYSVNITYINGMTTSVTSPL